MKRGTKIWLIVAASLVLLGIIIFGGVMAFLKWDFRKFGTGRFETNTYEISEEFRDISIDTDTADVAFLKSEDGKCRIVCYEEEKLKHSVSAVDGTLDIERIDTRKWYDHIRLFSFGNSMIRVYLPEAEYARLSIKESTGDVGIPNEFSFEAIDIEGSTGDVNCYASARGLIKIDISTGNICLEELSAGELELSTSTGKISLSSVECDGDIDISVDTGKTKLCDVSCKNLESDGDTGDISLERVIAAESFEIERDTGDVSFDGCDAAEIFVETSTGDVLGSLLSEKIFIAQTGTGKVDVPESTSGGKCKIATSTGDIKIRVE